MKTAERIQLSDTISSVIVKLAEGNSGAATACVELFKVSPLVDPDAMLGGVAPLLALDSPGIYGSRIWMLFSDVCGRDAALMIAVLRAHQLGFVTGAEIDNAVDGAGSGAISFDIQSVIAHVVERLPNFRKDALRARQARTGESEQSEPTETGTGAVQS